MPSKWLADLPAKTGVPDTVVAKMLDACIVGGVVLLACLFGIATRPAGMLAAMWPANALLLGLMVRRRELAAPLCWIAAAIGYLAADLLASDTLPHTALLTAANLTGVATGYALLSRMDVDDKRLRRPFSVLRLALAATVAAAAAGCAGALFNPILFDESMVSGWTFWFASELVNFIAILPVVLSWPDFKWPRRQWFVRYDVRRAIPAVALMLSCAASIAIGGPGAIAFPVPALLWCALTYTLPTTALLTLLFCGWTLLSISMGYFAIAVDINSRHSLLSIRIGVTLMALAPLTLASVMAARNDLLARLHDMAMHDPLTGLLSRRAFTESVQGFVANLANTNHPMAMLVLDIDYFKSINDNYGHAAGDRVLVLFARTTRECLRDSDVFGRMGGEEFAIFMPGCLGRDAAVVAERIRAAFAAAVIELDDDRSVVATVSVGVAMAAMAPDAIETLLSRGDRALYRAKAAGRNRVEFADTV